MDDDRLSPVSRKLRELIQAHGGKHRGVLHSYLVSLEEDAGRWKTDWLTGLPSREYTLERLSEELGRSFGDRSRPMGDRLPVSVGMFDLDKFKGVNDGPGGHAEGDRVLSDASVHFLEALEEAFGTLRDGDVLGRWGGDEFMLVLPATYMRGGFRAVDIKRQRIAAQENLGGVTVSGGVTSSDVVGVPLVYGNRGREMVWRYAEKKGVPDDHLMGAIGNYASLAGMDPKKVMDMLGNVYAFLVDSKTNPDSLDAGFKSIAVSLVTHYADKALYEAKRAGRNRVCAYGEDGLGSFNEQGLWVSRR